MLKRHSPLNAMSLKRIAELNAEAPVRVELCHRAHGRAIQEQKTIRRGSQKYEYTKVTCLNGICEICGKPANELHPHERPFKSHGGKLSLEQSVMCHNKCQAVEHGEPMLEWIR